MGWHRNSISYNDSRVAPSRLGGRAGYCSSHRAHFERYYVAQLGQAHRLRAIALIMCLTIQRGAFETRQTRMLWRLPYASPFWTGWHLVCLLALPVETFLVVGTIHEPIRLSKIGTTIALCMPFSVFYQFRHHEIC